VADLFREKILMADKPCEKTTQIPFAWLLKISSQRVCIYLALSTTNLIKATPTPRKKCIGKYRGNEMIA
jgi:hypothetical protein